MVATFGRGGLTVVAPGASFPPQSGNMQGNNLPGQFGYSLDQNPTERPGPGSDWPGYVVDGHVGVNDGTTGADPTRPKVEPYPQSTWVGAWGEGDPGSAPGPSGPPLTYGEGASRLSGIGGWGWAGRLNAPNRENLTSTLAPSFWRGGIQGFNDKLTVKDRHAFWNTGTQRQGTDYSPASSPPNTYNNPLQEGPQARLRTVNRTVSYQKGSDTTRNQDDLGRGYTWLGEQGSGWAPVYGGVPGMYIPYGSRGGVPYPIVDPTDGMGGREVVWAGPPHGLHSETLPDGTDMVRRYGSLVQMRPVRIDRPSNSPQAGQAYSQTVQFQGTTEGAAQPGGAPDSLSPWAGRSGSRGWAGARRPPGKGS
jgi:hypothetical protein